MVGPKGTLVLEVGLTSETPFPPTVKNHFFLVSRRRSSFYVVDTHPDPLSCKILQEFHTKQGVGGSESGLVYGPVPEKGGIGARRGPGLGMVWIRKKGVPGGGYPGWFYGVGVVEEFVQGFWRSQREKI